MKKCGLILSIYCLASCATIISGTTQDLSIDSNISEVSIYANDSFVCKTPCVFPAERASGSLTLIGKKEGYKDLAVNIKAKMNPVAFINFVFIYSWTTDFYDGAAWRYNKDSIYLNMKKENMTTAEIEQFNKNTEIRRFSLFNYPDLKIEASSGIEGEYIKNLSVLTNQTEGSLISKINQAPNETSLIKLLLN